MSKESRIVRPGEPVTVPWRDGGFTVPMSENRHRAFIAARAALIATAQAEDTISYKRLASAIDQRFGASQNHLHRLLEIISEDCHDRGEPSLAALVVTEGHQEVGDQFIGDAPATRAEAWIHWQ